MSPGEKLPQKARKTLSFFQKWYVERTRGGNLNIPPVFRILLNYCKRTTSAISKTLKMVSQTNHYFFGKKMGEKEIFHARKKTIFINLVLFFCQDFVTLEFLDQTVTA